MKQLRHFVKQEVHKCKKCKEWVEELYPGDLCEDCYEIGGEK